MSLSSTQVASSDLTPFGLKAQEAEAPRLAAEAQLRLCVQRIARRESAALAELYDSTINRVHAVAARIVANRETAEEVVSDVYFQAWRDAALYDVQRGTVQTWLLLICRSRALDALRRVDAAIVHPEPYLLAGAPIDEATDPLGLLEALERDTTLHAAMAQLSPLQRQLLALAFFRSYTHSEIASHAGMPLGTVKTHIREALRHLREKLSTGPMSHGQA